MIVINGLLAFFLTGLISFSGVVWPLNLTVASLFHFSGTPPINLGVNNGHLSDCPTTPNCVSSAVSDNIHYIEPISYNGDKELAKQVLIQVLNVVPNTVIIEEQDNYIRTQSASKIFGFVDDGEFYFPDDQKVIEVRYAARLGESDLGVNRRRLEQIRLALQDLGI